MSTSSSNHGAVNKTFPRPSDQALINAFLENVPDNVYFKDRASRFIAVSASFVRYFGMGNSADIIGKSDFDLFSEAHARPAFEDEQRIMQTGEPIVGKLEQETWPDGRVTWVLSSKLPLRNEDGEVIGTFGLSKDVTESRRIESELDNARKDLLETARLAGMAEVATGVLHNVGNVLNSVNVSASVLATGLRHSKDGEPRQNFRDAARTCAGPGRLRDKRSARTTDPAIHRIDVAACHRGTGADAEGDRVAAEEYRSH